jgi:hypothetical protein
MKSTRVATLFGDIFARTGFFQIALGSWIASFGIGERGDNILRDRRYQFVSQNGSFTS